MIEICRSFIIIGCFLLCIAFSTFILSRLDELALIILAAAFGCWIVAGLFYREHIRREACLNSLARRYRENRAQGGIMHINDNQPSGEKIIIKGEK